MRTKCRRHSTPASHVNFSSEEREPTRNSLLPPLDPYVFSDYVKFLSRLDGYVKQKQRKSEPNPSLHVSFEFETPEETVDNKAEGNDEHPVLMRSTQAVSDSVGPTEYIDLNYTAVEATDIPTTKEFSHNDPRIVVPCYHCRLIINTFKNMGSTTDELTAHYQSIFRTHMLREHGVDLNASTR